MKNFKIEYPRQYCSNNFLDRNLYFSDLKPPLPKEVLPIDNKDRTPEQVASHKKVDTRGTTVQEKRFAPTY